MKKFIILIAALFVSIPHARAQRFIRAVDSLAALNTSPVSNLSPDTYVTGANGGFFRWTSASAAATNAYNVIANPYGATAGRWIRQPGIGGTIDLGAAGLTFDGGANDYTFTVQDTSTTSIEGDTAQFTGLTDLTLDGQRDLTVFARTNFYLWTPRVWNLTAPANATLRLLDATTGKVDFTLNEVASVATLKAVPAAFYADGAIFRTLGYHASGDGGGASYRYSAASSATGDDAFTITPTHGTGRFLLQHDKRVSFRVLGANEVVANDTKAMSNAVVGLNAGTFNTLYIPPGNYLVNNGYSLTNNSITIEGDGRESLIQANRTQSGQTILFRIYGDDITFNRIGITRTDNSDTSVVANAYMKFWRLERGCNNFRLSNSYIDGNAPGQVYRAPYYYVELDADGRGIDNTQPNGIWISGNYFTRGTSRVLDLIAVRNVVITDNVFYNNGTQNYTASGNALNPGTCVELQSFDAAPGTVYPCYGVTIANNVFEYWGDGAINCAGAFDVTVTGNEMRGAGFLGLPPVATNQSENGIAFLGGGRISITGNKAYLLDETAILIRGQSTSGNLGKSITDVSIVGNVCVGGISLATNILGTNIRILAADPSTAVNTPVHENILVMGNVCRTSATNQGNLISVQATVANSVLRGVSVTGNQLYGPSTDITNSATAGVFITIHGSATVAGLKINDNQFYDLVRGITLDTATAFPANTYATDNQWNNTVTRVYNVSSSANALDSIARWSSGNEVRVSKANTFTIRSPSVNSLASSGTLTVAASAHHVAGSGGAVTLNSTTAITAGSYDGQLLYLIGTDNTNTVTVPDSGTCNLQSARTLGAGDILVLMYVIDDVTDAWYEVSFTNN